MGLNYIVVTGEALGTPEKKHTLEGQPVTSFNISINPMEESADVKSASIKITAGKKLADKCMQEVHNGDLVLVEGRLYTRVIENRLGQKQKLPFIQASNISVIKEKNANSENIFVEEPISDESDIDEIPF